MTVPAESPSPEPPAVPPLLDGIDEATAFKALDLARRELPPIEFGRLGFGTDGQVQRRCADQAIHFSFHYRGISFEGEMQPGQGGRLRLAADLGKLPYTVESAPARRLLRHLVLATQRSDRASFHITAAQDVLFVGETQVPAPRTPVSVVAAVTALTLDFKPFLELIEQVLDHALAPRAAD